MKVAVVGCGYVGLVTSVGLAAVSHEVTGIDADAERVAALERGEVPFHEPGLAKALRDTMKAGRFHVANGLDAAANADVVMLCVQTPPTSSGDVDLSFLVEAARGLGKVFTQDEPHRRVVVVRSTVPPGTTTSIVAPLLPPTSGVSTASNPEFLREGSAVEDFMHPDRIVIGTNDEWAAETLRKLYEPLHAHVMVTSPATAELAKYTSNAFLATLVSFSNEIAKLCEAAPDLDVEDVLGIVHHDRRLRTPTDGDGSPATIVSFLKAGCGYGGSCLPKDLSALIAFARELGTPATLLEAVARINREQPGRLVSRVEKALGGIAGRRVAVLGAAFKAGTDDLRDSPALRLVEELLGRNAAVVVYDPLVSAERINAAAPSVEVAQALDAALDGADACIVTTLEPEFRALETWPESGKGKRPLVVDGRRSLSPARFSDHAYLGVGRRLAQKAP